MTTLADLKRYRIVWTRSDGTVFPRIDVVSAFNAKSAIVKAVGGFTIGVQVSAVEVPRSVLDRAEEWVGLNRPDLTLRVGLPLSGMARYAAVTDAIKEILALDAAAGAAAADGGS